MWDKIGKFYGAKDTASAWPLLLVHLNIMLYALTFWISRPVFPFLSKSLGASDVVFGYLQTTFSFVQLGGNPVIGRLCDERGTKIALQMCQVATGVSYLLLGASFNIPCLFASQLPTVLMQSMHCAQAFVADFSSDETRSAALGKLSLSYGIGMAFGPMIGGLASDLIGYHGVAFLAGGLMFIPFFLNMKYLPARRPIAGAKENDGPKSGGGLNLAEIFNVLAEPNCRALTIFMLITGMAGQLYSSTFQSAGPTVFKLEARDLGFLQTMSAILGLIANTFFIGPIEKALSQLSIITAGAMCVSAAMFLYAFASNYNEIIVVTVLTAVPTFAMYTTLTSMLTKSASKENSATVIGLGHATRSAAGILAPTVGGYLINAYGTNGIGLICGVLMIVAAAYAQVTRPAPVKEKEG